eukprot:12361351-Alexandrium_andersonii.AAC.1
MLEVVTLLGAVQGLHDVLRDQPSPRDKVHLWMLLVRQDPPKWKRQLVRLCGHRCVRSVRAEQCAPKEREHVQ